MVEQQPQYDGRCVFYRRSRARFPPWRPRDGGDSPLSPLALWPRDTSELPGLLRPGSLDLTSNDCSQRRTWTGALSPFRVTGESPASQEHDDSRSAALSTRPISSGSERGRSKGSIAWSPCLHYKNNAVFTIPEQAFPHARLELPAALVTVRAFADLCVKKLRQTRFD